MIYIFLIPAIVFLISLWRRDYGVAAIIILLPSYLLRTTIHGIPTTALELSIYALSIAWLLRDVVTHHYSRPQLPRWMIVVYLVWAVAWILSTAFSSDHQASLGALKAWLVDPLLFGLVLISVAQASRSVNTILSAISLSGTMVAVAGLAQLIWFRNTLQDGRLSSFFHPVANYAAMFIAPILVLTVGALLWQKISRRWWTSAVIMFTALALTVSFGGYLSLGVGLIFLLYFLPNKKIKKRIVIAAFLLAIIGAVVLSFTPYLKEKINFSDRSSSLVRTQIWRTSVEMIKDHPVFGIGPNAYEKVYRATIPRLYFPPLEWLVSQPHQLYLALWLETGVLGLVTFLAFIGLWFKALWKRAQSGDDSTIIAVAAMLAILAHGFVDTPLFKNDLALMFVFVVLIPWLDAREGS